MSEKLQNENPPVTKNKYTWLYLAIPAIIIAAVVFHYGKGFILEKKAEKAVLDYVEDTYGDELDKFEYIIGDTISVNIGDTVSAKTTNYYLSFHEQKFWGGSFLIKTDLDGNIIYDGYKNWYLLGGTVIEHFNTLYSGMNNDLKKPLQAEAVQNNIFAPSDEFSVSTNILYKEDSAKGCFGPVLAEPQLDPKKEYTIEQIAKDYGEVIIILKTAKSSSDDFLRYSDFCAEYLKKSDFIYNNAIICLVPSDTGDTRYLAVNLTSDEISNGDVSRLINESAFEYTQADMEKDAQIVNSGADWPEPYRYAFICRMN